MEKIELAVDLTKTWLGYTQPKDPHEVCAALTAYYVAILEALAMKGQGPEGALAGAQAAAEKYRAKA